MSETSTVPATETAEEYWTRTYAEAELDDEVAT